LFRHYGEPPVASFHEMAADLGPRQMPRAAIGLFGDFRRAAKKELDASAARAQETEHLADMLEEANRVTRRAQRLLPEVMLEAVGLEKDTLTPDWNTIAAVRPGALHGGDAHYLHATAKFATADPDDPSRRPVAFHAVELRIDDLPALVEVAG